MRQIELEVVDESTGHAVYSDDDGRMLIVSLTHEGVIMDAFADGGNALVDSFAMTADEWYERITKGLQPTCILTEADILAGRDEDCTTHDHEPVTTEESP